MLELIRHLVRNFDMDHDAGSGGKAVLEMAFSVTDTTPVAAWADKMQEAVGGPLREVVAEWQGGHAVALCRRLYGEQRETGAELARLRQEQLDLSREIEAALTASSSPAEVLASVADKERRQVEVIAAVSVLERRAAVLEKLAGQALSSAETELRQKLAAKLAEINARQDAAYRRAAERLQAAVVAAYGPLHVAGLSCDVIRNDDLVGKFAGEALAELDAQ